MTKPVVIDETRPIDETRHDEFGRDRRHPAGGSPPSPQTVSASSLGVANEDAVDVGTVCACKGQVHTEYIPSAREYGQTGMPTHGGSKLRARYGDVAVRDLRPGSPDAGGGLRRKSHSHVWRVSEWYTSSRQRRGPPMCVSSKLPSSLIEYPLCPPDDTCNSTHAARHSKFQKLDAPRTVDRLGSRRLKETQIRI